MRIIHIECYYNRQIHTILYAELIYYFDKM